MYTNVGIIHNLVLIINFRGKICMKRKREDNIKVVCKVKMGRHLENVM